MTGSLTSIDTTLRLFANEMGAILLKDETKGLWLPKGFESRSLTWSKAGFNYFIQLYPLIEKDRIKKWVFSAYCFFDGDTVRYFKTKTFMEARKTHEIVARIDSLLMESYAYLQTLTFEDLES